MKDSRLRQVAWSMVVGWYLLMPPGWTAGPKRGQAETDAPLSRWGIFRSYDTAAECQTFLADLVRDASAAVATEPVGSDFHTTAAVTLYASRLSQCIATDDPRLRP